MKGKVVICGLGTHPVRETTLETLMALGACDEVHLKLADRAARAWIGGYCRNPKPAARAAAVAAAAKRGKTVGVAVWGHPQFTSGYAREVEAACRRAKVPFEVLAAISPVASVFARAIEFFGGDYGHQGVQAYDLETLAADPSVVTPRLPLVTYAEDAPAARWEALRAVLAALYGARHRVAAQAVGADDLTWTTVDALRGTLSGGAVLYLPPSGKPRGGG